MIFRVLLVVGLWLTVVLQSAWSPASAAQRIVMTWVAPYAIATTRTQLDGLYSGSGPRNALTHLGLQFWVPTLSGFVVKSSRYGTPSDATIHDFVTWAHANGVKVMLTVYNGENGWDWWLARKGFEFNRNRFTSALIAEMERLGLDGIDLDLEADSNSPYANGQRAAYVFFAKELARRVHLLGKQVTVDSFPYVWNAPNVSWWKDLFPYVDYINSMGYAELGRYSPSWQAYSWQKAAAGAYHGKLGIGVPSYESIWQDKLAQTHLDWFLTAGAGRTGVAIWDGQNQAAVWRYYTTWSRLKAVRDAP